jgi:tripartite-type tricarboxylate transporter receptor subunit TctC
MSFIRLRVAIVAFVGIALAGVLPARAQEEFPKKPITVLFGFFVGSGADIATRVEAAAMSRELGVPVVVRNVPGAGGRNSVTLLGRAKPDGYTAAIINVPGQLVNQIVRGMEPDLRTFVWIGRSVAQPYFLQASKKSGWTSLKDMQRAARPIRAGITGTGGNTFPISVIAASIAGYPVQFVPGFTSPEIIASLMRGDLDITTLPVGQSNVGAISQGDARGIAVYAPERHPMLPDVPTGSEQGFPALAAPTVMGTNLLALPPGTPARIANKLEAAMAKALKDPEVVKKVEDAGNLVRPLTGKQSSQLIEDMMKLVHDNASLLKKFIK